MGINSGNGNGVCRYVGAIFAPVRFTKTSCIFFEEVNLLGALLCYPGVGGSSPPWYQYLLLALQLGMWAPFKVGYRPNRGCSTPKSGMERCYVCSGALQENFLYFLWGSVFAWRIVLLSRGWQFKPTLVPISSAYTTTRHVGSFQGRLQTQERLQNSKIRNRMTLCLLWSICQAWGLSCRVKIVLTLNTKTLLVWELSLQKNFGKAIFHWLWAKRKSH